MWKTSSTPLDFGRHRNDMGRCRLWSFGYTVKYNMNRSPGLTTTASLNVEYALDPDIGALHRPTSAADRKA